MEGDQLFRAMVERNASDLYLKVGTTPHLRLDGRLQPLGEERLNRADILQFAYDLMGPERQQIFQHQREMNFAFQKETIGRFRANVLWQRGSIALVIRRVQDRLPTFETLQLPAAVLSRLCQERRGLILISGSTANGKSTTVASMLEHINRTTACHIMTLEDPIEFLFDEDRAVINQREVGVDTKSFSDGLKNVLRQSADVLYLSDLRDRETMESALLAAESGQLVFSCIHTTNVVTTIERIVTFFPSHQQETIRFRLSLVLKGILSQRLVPRRDGVGQAPACEILVMTPAIRECVREGRTGEIPRLLHDGVLQGMQTMTQALYRLVRAGWVSPEQALQIADSPEDLELALREIHAIRDAHEPDPFAG